MPRTFYSEIAPSAKSLGAAIGGGGGIKARGYRSGIADMANTDYLMSRAELARARADQLNEQSAPEDPNALVDTAAIQAGVPVQQARAWFQGQMGTATPDPTSDPSGDAAPAPSNVPPDLEKVLRGGLADLMTQKHLTGKTNFQQFEGGKKNKVQAQALEEALTQALDPNASTPKFARTLSVGAGKEITPYTTNAQGTVLDAQTGTLNEGGELAGAFRDLLGAKTDKETAHGELYDAKTDEADAGKTGKAVLDPAEIRTFRAYREIFPDKTPEEVLSIVKGRRSEDPAASRDKTKRELIKAHPRWTPEQINDWTDKLEAAGKKADAGGTKPAQAATSAPTLEAAHATNVGHLRSIKARPAELKAYVQKLKEKGWSRDEVGKMLDEAGVE